MKSKIAMFIAFLCFYSQVCLAAYSEEVCHDLEFEDAAWSINNARYQRMISDMTLADSTGHSTEERIRRIRKRIEDNHSRRSYRMPLSDDDLAKTILWAAECTGNDYRVFTALLEVESYICGDRTGPGGDSGCSMFTTPAVNVFRNQLQLPNRQSAGTQLGKRAYEELIEGCYRDYRRRRLPGANADMADDFIDLYKQSTRTVKDAFIGGDMIHADLLSGAIHLKLNSALAGGYWIPGRAPGGVNRYNASKHAAAYSRNVRERTYRIDWECETDPISTAVQFSVCLMSDDPHVCLEDLSLYYEGDSSTL